MSTASAPTTTERALKLLADLTTDEENNGKKSYAAPTRSLQSLLRRKQRITQYYDLSDGSPVTYITYDAQTHVRLASYRWAPSISMTSAPFALDDRNRLLSGVANHDSLDDGDLSTQSSLGKFSRIVQPRPKGSLSTDQLTTVARQQSFRVLMSDDSWRQIDWLQVRGAIIYFHGITENARFSLLANKQLSQIKNYADSADVLPSCDDVNIDNFCELTYETSWVKTLVDAGFVVFAQDTRGHGLSGGRRCYTQSLQCLLDDMKQYIRSLIGFGEIAENVPIFLSGFSLGGGLVIRCLQQGFGSGFFDLRKNDTDLSEPDKVLLSGAVLFAPALKIEQVKKLNGCLLPLAGFGAWATPKLRAAKLARSKTYPYITEQMMKDPLVYSRKLPVRMCWEIMKCVQQIWDHLDDIPKNLPLRILSCNEDTMTDPSGPEQFMRSFHGEDLQITFLDRGWHVLSKEPGYHRLILTVIDWLSKRTASREINEQEIDSILVA